MVNYNVFKENKEMLQKFSKYSKAYGVIFMLLGLVGIFFPEIMSLTTVLFLGWILLFSGILAAIHTWQTVKTDWLGWLKATVLFVSGILILFNPLPGVLALGIIFAAYFFVDAVANTIYAFKIKPDSTWWIALLNGVLSLAIGIFFVEAIGNPLKTIWLVGLLVGISLFFDGVMLLSMASSAKKKADSDS